MIANRPTVMEVNKYTSPVVTRLLNEYGKVTHPDFDRDLRAETGIGWKQVKNYRSHPEPTAAIPDNSKVIRFVYESRQRDRSYRAWRVITNVLGLALIFAILFMIGIDLRKTRDSVNLEELVAKRIESLMRQSDFYGCRKTGSVIYCPDGDYRKKIPDSE